MSKSSFCLLLLLFLAIFVQISFGQDDALRQKIEKSQTEADELAKKDTAESRKAAMKIYLENLVAWEKLNATEKQGETLNKLYEVAFRSGNYIESLDYVKKALPLFQQLGNRAMEGEMLVNFGTVYDAIGQSKEAIPHLVKAIEIFREIKDKKREGVALNVIGVFYGNLGDVRQSLDSIQQSLILRREVKDLVGEGYSLINLGGIYDDTGENEKAIEYYKSGLKIVSEAKDFRTESVALNNLGSTYSHLGKYQQALDYYQKALVIRRQINDKRGEGNSLNNVSSIYGFLGETTTAMQFMEEALQIFRQLGLKRNEAISLSSIGSLFARQSNNAKALEYYQKSMEIHRQINNKSGQSSTLRNIGVQYSETGQIEKATEAILESLKLAEETKETRAIGNSLSKLAILYDLAKDLTRAEEYFVKAEKILRDGKYRQDLLETLYHFARFENKIGRKDAALQKMKESIEIIEDARNSFTSQSFQTIYLAEKQKYYNFYIQLLIDSHNENPDKGFATLALKISESARARSLLDSLGPARKDIRGKVSSELTEEERILRQTINAKETKRLEAVRQNLTARATEIEKELAQLFRQHNDLQTKILQSNPQFATLSNPQPLNLQEIQKQVLDDETVLLEYVLGEKQSHLFFVTKNSLEIFDLPSREVIEKQIRQTLENLKARGQTIENETFGQRNERLKKADLDLEKNIAEASKTLLAPIVNKIQNKRLAIVTSGILQYLPFAVLKNNTNRYLIETNEVINLPSASIIPFLRNVKRRENLNQNQISIFADPVFSSQDSRLKPTAKQTAPEISETKIVSPALRSDYSRLRFSRIEAETISALASKNQRFVALDFAANLKSATDENLEKSRIIHFATHGTVNSQFPELSSIVLSLVDEQGNPQEGFLRLQDIYNLDLSADLVVLSACETALGKEIKGEGIIGLTRGFMFAGAPRVMASLWRVEDRATAELMKKFYQKMLVEKLKPIAALRQAQIAMLKEKSAAAPFYWAGFTLQGDF